MVLENLTSEAGNFLSTLSLAEGRIALEPLVIFVIGMVVYSIFVFKFYQFIASKRILSYIKGDSIFAKIGHAFEYIFLFPVVAFFWFFVLSVILTILSEVININNIFMVSMATMATIRVTAYYNELLSQDVAKLLPFALLAIFLLDISSLSIDKVLQVLYDLPSQTKILFYYFVFIVMLEFLLKILDYMWSSFSKQEKHEKPGKHEKHESLKKHEKHGNQK